MHFYSSFCLMNYSSKTSVGHQLLLKLFNCKHRYLYHHLPENHSMQYHLVWIRAAITKHHLHSNPLPRNTELRDLTETGNTYKRAITTKIWNHIPLNKFETTSRGINDFLCPAQFITLHAVIVFVLYVDALNHINTMMTALFLPD